MTDSLKVVNSISIPMSLDSKFPVRARDLWLRLGTKTKYAGWVNTRLKQTMAKENIDFTRTNNITVQTVKIGRGRPSLDISLTFDLACHFSMLEETEKGYAFRQYFIDAKKKLLQTESQTIQFLRNRISHLETLLSQPKSLPGKRTNMIAAPIYHENLFGVRDIIAYELRAKETMDDITKLKAQIRHMNKVLKGLGTKLDSATEKLHLEEARKDNKILKLIKPT